MVKRLRAMPQTPRGEKELKGAIKDSAQEIWLAGLGAFAKAQEEGEKVFKALVREGTSIQKRTMKVTEFKGSDVTAKVTKVAAKSATRNFSVVIYRPTLGVDDFVRQVAVAEPMVLVETERHGVDGRFLKDLSKRMEIPATHMFDMLGVPKATAEKKSAAGELVAGSGGQAAIGVAKLIALAQEIVANSTAKEASGFDAARWLGQWLDRPQPSLGGRKPAELIGTPTGVDVVTRLLGAIESGAYQ
jgi:putative toxin-antitoxin system antitoxin component (TIGR02293 family)